MIYNLFNFVKFTIFFRVEKVTCVCTQPPGAPKNCPCQVQPGVLSVPCQTVRSSVSEYFQYPNCFRNCKQTRNVQVLPQCNTKCTRKKPVVCRICKQRREAGDFEISKKKEGNYVIKREKSIIFGVDHDEINEFENQKTFRNADEDIKPIESGLIKKTVRASSFFVTVPFTNSFGKSNFYQEKQANFAFVQKGCKCKWQQSQRGVVPPCFIRQCPVAMNCSPGCMCKPLDPPHKSVQCNGACSAQCSAHCSAQCSNCPWFDGVRNDYQDTRYVQTAIAAPITRYFCCPNCSKKSHKPKPRSEHWSESELESEPESSQEYPWSLSTQTSIPTKLEPQSRMEDEPSDLSSDKSTTNIQRQKTRMSYPLYARSTPFFDDLYKKKNVDEQSGKGRSHFVDKITNLLSKYYALKWESDLAQSTNEYGNSFLSDFIQVNDVNRYLKRLQAKLERERLATALASKIKKKSFVIEPKSSSSKDSEKEIRRKKKRVLKALFNNVLNNNHDEVSSSKNGKKRHRSESKTRRENIKEQKNSEESLGRQIDNFNKIFEKINKITKESRFNVKKLQNVINSQEQSKPERHKTQYPKSENIRRSAVKIKENDAFLDIFKAIKRRKESSGKNNEWSDSSSSSTQEILKPSRNKQASKKERKKPKPNLKIKAIAIPKSKNPTRRRK